MAKHSHPELDGHESQALYTFQLKKRGQEVREKTFWVLMGLVTGIGLTVGGLMFWTDRQLPSWPFAKTSVSSAADPFKQGTNHAMQAAELTQSAEFQEDWVTVALQWQYALNQMQIVPKDHPHYSVAQQKLAEYERNLQYAQSNITTRSSRSPVPQDYWTIGSNRELLMAIQGVPTQIVQYASSCYEVWNYGDSIVELENGYVKQYDNFGNNLKVLETGQVAQSMQAISDHWTLGSTQEEVYQIQGTPTRTHGASPDAVSALYYGSSSILLDNGLVVGYLNVDGNLKVSTKIFPGPSSQSAEFWSLGATRADVLNIQQQTPMAVSRNDDSCEEIYQFGTSEVIFSQGLVSGYRNLDGNLRVR